MVMSISSITLPEGRPVGGLKRGGLDRADLAIAAVLFVAGVLLYLPFRSASLDDFDSFNFARAIVSFSPADFRPHPPGYALYVALGRVALALAGEPRLALTTLSALCGGVSLALIFALGRVLSGRLAGLSAALLLAGTPLMWLNSEKALSDVPGLAALLGSALLLALAAYGGRVPPWVAAAAIGAAAGFRPQAMLGLGLAFLVAAVACRWHARQLAASGLALLAGVLAWLLPVLAALGWSLDRLRGYMTGAAGFVTSQESLFATAVTPASLLARWQAVWGWSSSALVGPWPEAVRVTLVVALAGLAWHGARRNPGAARFCLAWLLPQALLHLLFLNPELTRYGLALWPPVLLLAGIGLAEISGRTPGYPARRGAPSGSRQVRAPAWRWHSSG